MVKDHSDNQRRSMLSSLHRLLFLISNNQVTTRLSDDNG